MIINKAVSSSTVDLTGSLSIVKIATTIDIKSTGKYSDASQQAWDSLITIIGMRAQPIVLSEPKQISFSTDPEISITGSGYVFEFGTEHNEIFATHDEDNKVIDPVGVLKILLEDVELNGESVKIDENFEIVVTERY